MAITVVIVAGGKGARMQDDTPKQFLNIAGKPVIYYAIHTFLSIFPNAEIIVAIPKGAEKLNENWLGLFPDFRQQINITEGGETRFHSVKNGLKAMKQCGVVFIHDAARPFINEDLIKKLLAKTKESGNAIPAITVSDSMRKWNGTEFKIIDREQLRIIQTPQVFDAITLKSAYDQAYNPIFTDDASVMENFGMKIHLIDGSKNNIKITTPEDLVWAEFFLKNA